MAGLEILEGVEVEYRGFRAKERGPFWPNVPTPCQVTGCGNQVYNTCTSYQCHWTAKHCPTLTLYQCPNCDKRFGRKDNASRHQRLSHKMASEIEKRDVGNKNYIDPAPILPYQVDHRARMAEKREKSGQFVQTGR